MKLLIDGAADVFVFAACCMAIGIAVMFAIGAVLAAVDRFDQWRERRFWRRAALLCSYCLKKPLAYPGALYCGAACAARHEVATYRMRPARVCKDVEVN